MEPDAAGVGRLDAPLPRVREHVDVERVPVVVEQRVAEGRVGLVERPGVVLDHGEVHPRRLAEVRHQLHADVAEPHDDAGVAEGGRVEHVRARRHLDVVDAGQRREVHRRAGRDHDVVGIDGPVADREAAVADEPRGVAVERDPVPLRELLDGGAAVSGEVRRVLVLPRHDRFEIDVRERAGEAVVVPRREPVFGRRQDLFRGHAAAEDTEPPAGVAVVDQRQLDVRRVREPLGGGDAGAPVRADDRDVRWHTPTLSVGPHNRSAERGRRGDAVGRGRPHSALVGRSRSHSALVAPVGRTRHWSAPVGSASIWGRRRNTVNRACHSRLPTMWRENRRRRTGVRPPREPGTDGATPRSGVDTGGRR